VGALPSSPSTQEVGVGGDGLQLGDRVNACVVYNDTQSYILPYWSIILGFCWIYLVLPLLFHFYFYFLPISTNCNGAVKDTLA
jgi:hypothetical protein